MSLDSEVRKRSDMMEETGPDPDPVITSPGSTIKTTTITCKNNRKWLLLNTHLNAVIYSSCFWVQIGVLPVSENIEDNFIHEFTKNLVFG